MSSEATCPVTRLLLQQAVTRLAATMTTEFAVHIYFVEMRPNVALAAAVGKRNTLTNTSYEFLNCALIHCKY